MQIDIKYNYNGQLNPFDANRNLVDLINASGFDGYENVELSNNDLQLIILNDNLNIVYAQNVKPWLVNGIREYLQANKSIDINYYDMLVNFYNEITFIRVSDNDTSMTYNLDHQLINVENKQKLPQ